MKEKVCKNCHLEIPSIEHKEEYTRMMDRWETIEKNIQPELVRRYSTKLGKNVDFAKWLEWCEDDRTTGSMLSTGIPCTLYLLIADYGEIMGAIAINHARTHRGHLHAGIAPWNRNQGYGSEMLKLALEICKSRGMSDVEIVTQKENKGAIQTILNNDGVLLEEFCENNCWSQRYVIKFQ